MVADSETCATFNLSPLITRMMSAFSSALLAVQSIAHPEVYASLAEWQGLLQATFSNTVTALIWSPTILVSDLPDTPIRPQVHTKATSPQSVV